MNQRCQDQSGTASHGRRRRSGASCAPPRCLLPALLRHRGRRAARARRTRCSTSGTKVDTALGVMQWRRPNRPVSSFLVAGPFDPGGGPAIGTTVLAAGGNSRTACLVHIPASESLMVAMTKFFQKNRLFSIYVKVGFDIHLTRQPCIN